MIFAKVADMLQSNTSKNAAKRLAAAAIVSLGLISIPSTPEASAAPSCKTWQEGKTGFVSCKGVHSHRVHVSCRRFDVIRWKHIYHSVRGEWVGDGQVSSATCENSRGIEDVGYDTQ